MKGKYKNINLSFEELENVSSIEYRHFAERMQKIYPFREKVIEWDSYDYDFGYDFDYSTQYKQKPNARWGENRNTNEVIDVFAQLKWETGGVSGGSCWDSSDPQPYDTYTEYPKSDLLPRLVCNVLKNLDILIATDSDWDYVIEDLQDFVREDDYTEYEYYGNYTNYNILKISLKDLYAYLIKTNLM
jgi:hypothetical protein